MTLIIAILILYINRDELHWLFEISVTVESCHAIYEIYHYLQACHQTDPDHSQADLFGSAEPKALQDDIDGTENGCDCKCCKLNYGMLKRIATLKRIIYYS